MKWFIASDVHGSAFYCQKMLENFKREKADRVLLLGDILYHGPRNDLPKDYDPKRVTAMLNEYKDDIIGVRGNCDADIDQVVLEFPMMADYAFLTEGKRTIFATHGHLFNKDVLPPLHDGDIILHGHTHVPICEMFDSYIYMNPGSVSIPKENSTNSYMTLEDGVFEWKDMEGNVFLRYAL